MRRAPLSSPNKRLPYAEFIETQDKRVSSAGVLIENNDGELLVVKSDYKPYWSIPGGMIEAGESPREAAAREVGEEIGFEIESRDLVFRAVINRRSPIAETYLFVFALDRAVASDTQFTFTDGEIVATEWVTKTAVLEHEGGKYNRAIQNWASKEPSEYIEHKTWYNNHM